VTSRQRWEQSYPMTGHPFPSTARWTIARAGLWRRLVEDYSVTSGPLGDLARRCVDVSRFWTPAELDKAIAAHNRADA